MRGLAKSQRNKGHTIAFSLSVSCPMSLFGWYAAVPVFTVGSIPNCPLRITDHSHRCDPLPFTTATPSTGASMELSRSLTAISEELTSVEKKDMQDVKLTHQKIKIEAKTLVCPNINCSETLIIHPVLI